MGPSTGPSIFDYLGDPEERRRLLLQSLDATSRGVIAGGLGGAADMGNALLNLGKAAYGYAGHKAGLLSADQMPQLNDKPMLGSEWIGDKMQGAGLLGSARNPMAEGIAGGLLAPAAATRGPQVVNALLAAERNMAAPVAMGQKAGQRGIFMGDLSKTWDKTAAAKAQAMEKAGADPRAIWQETGTFKGVDGKWRQEIDDGAAALTERAQQVFTPGVVNADRSFDAMLPDAMTHKAFTDAYPMSVGVKATNDPTGGASFMSGSSPFSKDGLYRTVEMSKGAQEPGSTLLHELQHAVQEQQGFAKGGSARNFVESSGSISGTKLRPEAQSIFDAGLWDGMPKMAADEVAFRQQSAIQEAYRRLAGEAEARAVEKRVNLTAQQRRSLFPLDSYDVPINSLIVR